MRLSLIEGLSPLKVPARNNFKSLSQRGSHVQLEDRVVEEITPEGFAKLLWL